MTTFQPPAHLSEEAAKWWRQLMEEFELADPGALLLLQTALEAFDRLKEVQRIIGQDGPALRDRFEQVKPHPLLTTERDTRSQMLAAIKQLNLDIEPLRDGPGRPPGR